MKTEDKEDEDHEFIINTVTMQFQQRELLEEKSSKCLYIFANTVYLIEREMEKKNNKLFSIKEDTYGSTELKEKYKVAKTETVNQVNFK